MQPSRQFPTPEATWLMTTTGRVRTAYQPRSTGFELVDDEEASRHRFLACTFPSCSPGTARPVVPNRPDFVAAAPTLPGVPRVRLPPASPRRYDDQAIQVSHLHPKQQRLVAHDVLVDTDHGDSVEPARVSIRTRLPSARTASLAVFHATASPSATRAIVRCWTTSA